MKASCIALLLVCAVAPTGAVAQGSAPVLAQHIIAAQQAQAKQDCAAAAKEYAAAVHLAPASGELRTNLGIALYCDNRFVDAVTALHKALALNPELAVPHLFLGLAAFHLSDYPAAVHELQTATRLMPGDVTGNLWLGYAQLEQHDSIGASSSFQAVLHTQPSNVDARYALGQAWFEEGRQRVLQLVSTYPGGRGIRLLLAQQQALRSGTPMQEQAGTPATWKSPQEEQLYRQASDAEEKAEAALQQVIDTAPASDRAHQIQGDIASLQRNNEVAIHEYRQVLQINPALPGVRLALANCLMQIPDFAQALQVLNQERTLTPRSANVAAAIGRVQLAMGNDTDAIASLKTAIGLPGSPPEARLLLGQSLLRSGDAKAALPYLEQALHEGADPATANYLLARAYRSTGNRAAMLNALEAYRHVSKDEAERQAATAITRSPAALPTAMSTQEAQDASAMSVTTN